jgi:hypothetical protein
MSGPAIAIDPTLWPGHADKLLLDACWTMANPNEISEALHMIFAIMQHRRGERGKCLGSESRPVVLASITYRWRGRSH